MEQPINDGSERGQFLALTNTEKFNVMIGHYFVLSQLVQLGQFAMVFFVILNSQPNLRDVEIDKVFSKYLLRDHRTDSAEAVEKVSEFGFEAWNHQRHKSDGVVFGPLANQPGDLKLSGVDRHCVNYLDIDALAPPCNQASPFELASFHYLFKRLFDLRPERGSLQANSLLCGSE